MFRGNHYCECLPGYFGTAPSCRPECVTNSDCPRYLACVNEKCTDTCTGACDPEAVCQVVNHAPICTCRDGYHGDPYTRCTIIRKHRLQTKIFYI